MRLHPSLFLLFLSSILVSGHSFLDGKTTKRPRNGEPMEGRRAPTRNPDRQQRSVSSQGNPNEMLKVLDFSEDVDHEPDSNGEYTSATLEAGPLPESFTICSAFMVEAWTTEFTSANMFTLLDHFGYPWGSINLFAASSFTEYEVWLGPVSFSKQTGTVFYPLQWTRACVSFDSVASKVTRVVDEQLLGEEEYKREEDKNRPANLSLVLGFNGLNREYTGRVSEFNIFNSSLSEERMIAQTTAGGEECGAPGDLVNLEEAEWTLHSQIKVIKVGRDPAGGNQRSRDTQSRSSLFFHFPTHPSTETHNYNDELVKKHRRVRTLQRLHVIPTLIEMNI